MKFQSKTFYLFLASAFLSAHNANGRLWESKNEERELKKKEKSPSLTVMTRNLYSGADLFQIAGASNEVEIIQIATTIWREAYASNYDKRMDAIAQEIEKTDPDLVALQEAVEVTISGLPGTDDFVADMTGILREKLEDRGLQYQLGFFGGRGLNSLNFSPVWAVDPSTNEPTPGCTNPLPGAAGLEAIGFNLPFPFCILTFRDFNPILQKEETDLGFRGFGAGIFDAQNAIDLGVTILNPRRRYHYFDYEFEGHVFRFLNAHLELSDEFNQMQAEELLEEGGPARVPEGRTLILAGDLNSAAESVDFSSDQMEFGSTAYDLIVGSGLSDVWVDTPGGGPNNGNTFGQSPRLDNRQDQSYVRLDGIFIGSGASAKPGSVKLVGHQSLAANEAPYWASDHAGVVATIVFDD